MHIDELQFSNVGPFQDVHFDFHPQVNVFTGPNNSGKSTVLWVLGDVLVYPFSLPLKLLRDERPATFEIKMSDDSRFSGELPVRRTTTLRGQDGESAYWTEERWKEHVDVLERIGYTKFVPALRRSTDFRSPGPMAARQGREATVESRVVHRPRLVRGEQNTGTWRLAVAHHSDDEPELAKRLSLVSEDASLISDEDVIQKIIELDYRSYLRENRTFRHIVDKIGEMTTDITEGYPISFAGVDEDPDGFFPTFQTVDGTMPLNTLSQGTQSIIQWLAHLLIGFAEYYDFPRQLEDAAGILIIDEIDAHLHPAWQRGIIPTLTDHFPNLQIFCSTHSPLMLAGLGPGQVQLLARNDDHVVRVSKNEESVAGWSADQILRNLLDVRNPTDRKTVQEFDRLEELRTQDRLNPDEAKELATLTELAETRRFPGSASKLIDELVGELERLQDDESTT